MLDNVGHKTVICGPESFTPDSMPLFGETPEVRKKMKKINEDIIDDAQTPDSMPLFQRHQ